jgi:hypothetical protein
MPTEIETLLDELDHVVPPLQSALETNDLEEIRRRTEPVLAGVRALGDVLTEDLKKGPYRNLQKHVRFVEIYTRKADIRMVRGNVRSLRPDTLALRAKCASTLPSPDPALVGKAVELTSGPYKRQYVDAVASFGAGAFGPAIVSAVSSLEGLLRDLFKRKFGRDSSEFDFKSVVDKLETEGHLTRAEAPLLQVLRVYRNLTAHPADFQASRDDAIMVLNYVFPRLKVDR